MKDVNDFYKDCISQSKPVTYEVEGLQIKVPPHGFPPLHDYSISTTLMIEALPNLKGKNVLDIATGSGVLALVAAKRGAREVFGTDIDSMAIIYANVNAQQENLDRITTFLKGDMFESVPRKQYDVILANIPITDEPVINESIKYLTDPGNHCHNILFAQGSDYLAKDGIILMPHADFYNKGFLAIEALATKNNFSYDVVKEQITDVPWRIYEFRK